VKKALLVSLLIVVAMGASCQTVVYKSQATLQWAAVTQDSGGNAFLPTDVSTSTTTSRGLSTRRTRRS
jgi:hypothetical protein